MKIRKMENKELKKVVGQCCCKIVGKPSVYGLGRFQGGTQILGTFRRKQRRSNWGEKKFPY